jgi:hypothetical protein
MTDEKTLHLYLPEKMRADAAAGQVNIVNRIAQAVAAVGYGMAFHPDTAAARASAAHRSGYHLFHMHEPEGPRTLCLRRAYYYPFWRIEATNARWDWDVARAGFAGASDPAAAQGFFRRWREKIAGPTLPRDEGYVFMPLQGRLTEHRSFQSMSPVAMIEATLEAEPGRDILATLHPRESYDADERAAITAIGRRTPRFRLLDTPAHDLVAGCSHIVTQNSSVALSGYFSEKKSVLFGRIDFHHIAGSVPREGLEAAFARLKEAPDFAGYLFWFFRENAINGGAPDAEARILARFRRHGWVM